MRQMLKKTVGRLFNIGERILLQNEYIFNRKVLYTQRNTFWLRTCRCTFTSCEQKFFNKNIKNNFLCNDLQSQTVFKRYISNDDEFDVTELSGSDFHSYLKTQKHLFVFFYDPLCPHCRKAEPEFLKAARLTKVPCAKVDGSENEHLCKTLQIDSFPTFRYFTFNGKPGWVEYSGNRKAHDMLSFMSSNAKSKGLLSIRKNISVRCYSTKAEESENKLVRLTSENIHEKLKGSHALVLFYTTPCVECESLVNVFREVAQSLDSDLGFVAVCDATNNAEISQNFSYSRYPAIKYFINGAYVADFKDHPDMQNIKAFMTKMKNAKKFKTFESKLSQTQKTSIWKGLEGAENIIHVTSRNLTHVLTNYPSVLIFFYACWSRSCLDAKVNYAQAAMKLDKSKGVLAACDAEDNTDVADQFQVSRFPTFKYFSKGQYLTDYQGEVTETALLKFMQEPKQHYEIIEQRIKPNYSKLSLTGNIPGYWTDVLGSQSMLFMTDYNYRTILRKYKIMLVMFYVSWCKACTLMKHEYGKAALALPPNSELAIAACDAEENNVVADKFLVTKLPTMKLFRDGDYIEDYSGPRREKDFISYLKNASVRAGETLPKKNTDVLSSLTDMLVFWNNVDGGHNISLINKTNFKSALRESQNLLVMFYYPGVSDIEVVKKEYGTAAKKINKESGTLAAYQFDRGDPVCQTYKVTFNDLPVFKHFKRGNFIDNFRGDRTSDSILEFMRKTL